MGVVLAKKSRFAKTDDFPFAGQKRAETRHATAHCRRAPPARGPPPMHTHRRAALFMGARARGCNFILFCIFKQILKQRKKAHARTRAHAHAKKTKTRKCHKNHFCAPKRGGAHWQACVRVWRGTRLRFRPLFEFSHFPKMGSFGAFFSKRTRARIHSNTCACAFLSVLRKTTIFPFAGKNRAAPRTKQGGPAP